MFKSHRCGFSLSSGHPCMGSLLEKGVLTSQSPLAMHSRCTKSAGTRAGEQANLMGNISLQKMQGALLGWAATQVVMTAQGHRLPGLAAGRTGLSAPTPTCITLSESRCNCIPGLCVCLCFSCPVSNLLVLC